MDSDHKRLEQVEIDPLGQPGACVIWLHGLGADGHDFEPIVTALDLPSHLGIRFVLPHAPRRPITINRGAIMRGWYDIANLGGKGSEDEQGIRESGEAVSALIDAEVARGIPSQRILLAGFSQGGAIALHTGLRYTARLGGIVALSAYLPLRSTLIAEGAAANRGLPIMMAHGTWDDIVPLALGRRSYDELTAQGYGVEWREYPMGHSVCPEEVTAITDWLRQHLEQR